MTHAPCILLTFHKKLCTSLSSHLHFKVPFPSFVKSNHFFASQRKSASSIWDRQAQPLDEKSTAAARIKKGECRVWERSAIVWETKQKWVQSGAAGFYTRKGEKLSKSQAAWLNNCAWMLLSFSLRFRCQILRPHPVDAGKSDTWISLHKLHESDHFILFHIKFFW